MAKTTKVGTDEMTDEVEEKAPVETPVRPNPVQAMVEEKVLAVERKAASHDLALQDLASTIESLMHKIEVLTARLDAEKEARFRTATNVIAGMDEQERARMILDVVLNKYVSGENNNFETLVENPAIIRRSMKNVMKLAQLYLNSFEDAVNNG